MNWWFKVKEDVPVLSGIQPRHEAKQHNQIREDVQSRKWRRQGSPSSLQFCPSVSSIEACTDDHFQWGKVVGHSTAFSSSGERQSRGDAETEWLSPKYHVEHPKHFHSALQTLSCLDEFYNDSPFDANRSATNLPTHFPIKRNRQYQLFDTDNGDEPERHSRESFGGGYRISLAKRSFPQQWEEQVDKT